MAVAPVASWTGVYVGAAIGARIANNDWTSTDVLPTFAPVAATTPTSDSADSTAARFGGYAGFNWQFAPQWVSGVEGYGGYANNKKTLNPIPGSPFVIGGLALTNNPSATVKETWDAGVRARLGYLVTPSTLVYATGGAAWQRVELQSSCPAFGAGTDFCFINEGEPKASKTMTGWTVGGGVEFRLTANWFARFDYQFADYGTFTHTFFVAGATFDDRYTANVKVQTHTANFAVAYLF